MGIRTIRTESLEWGTDKGMIPGWLVRKGTRDQWVLPFATGRPGIQVAYLIGLEHGTTSKRMGMGLDGFPAYSYSPKDNLFCAGGTRVFIA